MDLAKQGDPQAIAALINRSLTSKGIHATASLAEDCLTISLQANQIPNQKAVVAIIQRGMLILQVEQIKRLKILTYRSDNNYLAWQHELNLTENTIPTEVSSLSSSSQAPISSTSPTSDLHHQNMQPQNAQLTANPPGAILAQNLSQLHHNLEEYQDIIVRFTDEQIGTVRCLTTLTELIQVISKPSFLFATVAASPNLRNLLDAIAESSQTDAQGDQVITNLSILQPGHQWQKAKIRLVSKIFLETDQDSVENRQNDLHQGITLDLPHPAPDILAASPSPAPQPVKNIEPVASTVAKIEPVASTTAIKPQEVSHQIETDAAQNTTPNIDQALEKVLEESPQLLVEKLQDLLHKQEHQEQTVETAHSPSADSSSLNSVDNLTNSPSSTVIPATSVIVDAADRNGNLTAESLFDDFPNASNSSLPEPAIANLPSDDSNSSNDLGDDLFDSFGNPDQSESTTDETLLAEQPYPLEIAPQPTLVRQVQEETLISNTDDDLFGEFHQASGKNTPNGTKFVSDALNTNESLPQSYQEQYAKSDFESILSSIDTVAISGPRIQPSDPSMTLEDFADDLQSIGF
jgi:hypothetical protein